MIALCKYKGEIPLWRRIVKILSSVPSSVWRDATLITDSVWPASAINDKISPNSETLIGVEGFKSIQIDEINDDTYLVY